VCQRKPPDGRAQEIDSHLRERLGGFQKPVISFAHPRNRVEQEATGASIPSLWAEAAPASPAAAMTKLADSVMLTSSRKPVHLGQ
jgi:hypothetical protein